MNNLKVLPFILFILTSILSTRTHAQKLEVEGEAAIGSPGWGNNLLTLVSERNWIFRQFSTGPSTALELYDATGYKNFLINTTGNVGIGITLPNAKLDVNGMVKAYNQSEPGIFGESPNSVGVYGKSNSDNGVYGESSSFSGVFGVSKYDSGVFGQSTSGTGVSGWSFNSESYDFDAIGPGINYGSTSSRRWKKNIINIPSPLEKITRLRGVYFDWDEAHGGHHDVGFIAEEIGEVLPEIVGYEENGSDATGLDYSKMTPLLVEAVNAMRKEYQEKINTITVRLDDLTKLLQKQNANHSDP
jgi:hypothetical protein